MTTVAAVTFWPLLALVVTPALVLAVPVVVHHLAAHLRDQRSHRRAIELARSRREAHNARKWAQVAADDRAIAEARAETKRVESLAVQLLQRNDQLQAERDRLQADLDAAVAVVHRQNRAQLGVLARVIEADQTLRLPVVRVLPETRRVPAIPTTATDHRRSVLATA